MFKHPLTLAAAALLFASGAHSQATPEFATGNMHFDAKAMHANADGMISKDEFMKYGDTMWQTMAKGAPSIPVTQAGQDFARGNLRFNAKAMDTDHDGTISKDEFMKYAEQKFDKMKNSQGMISLADATANFARGNQRVASKPDDPKANSAPAK
ncbi:MAG TPA: EF-hand domain-containing protein [Steroidobacteraceae bacterium]|nr:EF-hand domain-containing protein [Steroidobacteraceae bacterium]